MLAAAHSNITKICTAESCERPIKCRGLCAFHYKRAVKSGEVVTVKPTQYSATCGAPDCASPSAKRGYCDMHYRRIQRRGTLDTVRQPPGGLVKMSGGYITQRIDGEKKLHHVRVVEAAIGKKLPPKAEVHHFNEITSDNRPENLVVCPDRSYHRLLHERQKAFDDCGHASWRKCTHCKQYDDPKNMSGGVHGKAVNAFYHRACAARYVREGKARRKLQKAA